MTTPVSRTAMPFGTDYTKAMVAKTWCFMFQMFRRADAGSALTFLWVCSGNI
jgi:hypothetical protein